MGNQSFQISFGLNSSNAVDELTSLSSAQLKITLGAWWRRYWLLRRADTVTVSAGPLWLLKKAAIISEWSEIFFDSGFYYCLLIRPWIGSSIFMTGRIAKVLSMSSGLVLFSATAALMPTWWSALTTPMLSRGMGTRVPLSRTAAAMRDVRILKRAVGD